MIFALLTVIFLYMKWNIAAVCSFILFMSIVLIEEKK